jgi:hypothetical protein
VELKEIGSLIVIDSGSEEIGNTTLGNGFSCPFFRFVGSLVSENRSPSSLRELKVETGRLRFRLSSFVEGIVHPHLIESSTHISFLALTNLLGILAGTRRDYLRRTVSEISIHPAPDGTVRGGFPLARLDFLDLTVFSYSDCNLFGGLGIKLSCHRTIKATRLCSLSSCYGT